jgi:hypothetical protein
MLRWSSRLGPRVHVLRTLELPRRAEHRGRADPEDAGRSVPHPSQEGGRSEPSHAYPRFSVS